MVGVPFVPECLYQAIPYPIVTLDAGGHIVCCNAAFADLVKRSASALKDVPFHSLLSAPQYERFNATFQGLRDGGQDSFTLQLKFTHQPQHSGYHSAVMSSNNGSASGATIMIQQPVSAPGGDVGPDRDLAMHILDQDPDMVYVRDSLGSIRYCNEAFASLLGMSKDAALCTEPYMYPAGASRVAEDKALERRVLETGEEVHIEEAFRDSRGEIRHFQTLKKALRPGDGDAGYVLSISSDINRLSTEARENLQVNKAREDLFAALSHELRTPLNAVVGMADILLKRHPRKDQKKLLQTLNFSAKSLLGLISNILDFSKIGAGKIELEYVNFNLPELLDNLHQSLRSWASGKGLELSLVVGRDVPQIVRGDSMKISQILNNLVSNAIKFTESGSVHIVAEEAGAHDRGHTIRLTVRDTGIGMTGAQQAVVFDPYKQAENGISRKFGGTGLGLSIVKDLVDMMGGTISLQSRSGEGTAVEVLLPLQQPDDQPVQSIALPQVGNAKWQVKLHVLYVEDVSTNQVLVEEMLGDWGIDVDMASSGPEAIEKMEHNTYDLVLMDIQMPGMDGFETARKIREGAGQYRKEVPIIAMTAATSASTRRRILGSGMQDVIQKPINIEELRGKIIEYSSIEESIIPEAAAEEETRDDHWVSFQKTDMLFQNNRMRYQEFLRMALEELGINKDLLKAAIREEDMKAFRSINHRMKNLLVTLEMHELLEHLEHTRQRMTEGTSGARENGALQRALTNRIDRSLDKIGNKLASLKWQ